MTLFDILFQELGFRRIRNKNFQKYSFSLAMSLIITLNPIINHDQFLHRGFILKSGSTLQLWLKTVGDSLQEDLSAFPSEPRK